MRMLSPSRSKCIAITLGMCLSLIAVTCTPLPKTFDSWVLTETDDGVSRITIYSVETQALSASIGDAMLYLVCDTGNLGLRGPSILWEADDPIGGTLTNRGHYQIAEQTGDLYFTTLVQDREGFGVIMHIDDNTFIDVSYAKDVEIFDAMLMNESAVSTIYPGKLDGENHVMRFMIVGLSEALNDTPCQFASS